MTIPFGNAPMVNRFLKGIFNLRSALSTSVKTWNVVKVCHYIKAQLALAICDLKTVSDKLAILLLYLTTGQRGQTINPF